MVSTLGEASKFTRGAIRSRVVARLSGATVRQLQYWHETQLLSASVISGSRGTPRLYSWVDYLRARAAVKLLRAKVPNRRLRGYIEFLEMNVPAWYSLTFVGFEGRAFIADVGRLPYEASAGGQSLSRELALAVVEQVQREGPLGDLRSFADWIDMRPSIHGGSPTLRGTRIETEHVAALVRHGTATSVIASRNKLELASVDHAIEFEAQVRSAA